MKKVLRGCSKCPSHSPETCLRDSLTSAYCLQSVGGWIIRNLLPDNQGVGKDNGLSLAIMQSGNYFVWTSGDVTRKLQRPEKRHCHAIHICWYNIVLIYGIWNMEVFKIL